MSVPTPTAQPSDERELCGPLSALVKGDFSLEYVTARYRVPWHDQLAERAQTYAIGMTVGSWLDLPDAEKPHLRRYLGEVGAITREGDAGYFEIKYPVDNVRPSISSLLTVVFGKLSLDGLIRLDGLSLPDGYASQFPGPAWGIAGLRSALNIPERPLVMSIFKSENGRDLAEFQDAFEEQLAGGVDVVKDDEIYMADENAPLLARIEVAREALERRESATGQKGLYVAALSGTPSEMLELAHQAQEAGAQGFLISAFTTGLDVLVDMRRTGIRVPLILHPAFSGGQVGSVDRGVHPRVLLGQLPRLAGADVVLYPSPYGSVAMVRDESLAVAEALKSPLGIPASLPGPSAGIHAGILPQLFRDFGPDIVVNAGGAIHGHPGGTRLGARVLSQAAERFREVSAS
jgi:2,3-diketo-5-methylthiopentyl-1-phosphate enolase